MVNDCAPTEMFPHFITHHITRSVDEAKLYLLRSRNSAGYPFGALRDR